METSRSDKFGQPDAAGRAGRVKDVRRNPVPDYVSTIAALVSRRTITREQNAGWFRLNFTLPGSRCLRHGIRLE
jgi:hypothetical protein